MAPVNIRVKTFLPNLHYFTDCCEIQDTSMTWRDVMSFVGVPVDSFGKYWVTNSRKTIMMVPDDNVEHFISQFKRKMNPYIVHLFMVTDKTMNKYWETCHELLDIMPVENAQPQQQIIQNNENIDDDDDSDDSMEEVDYNIKEAISQKLMETFTNGDLTFIKNEFSKMKSEGKMMDSARNLPATMLFLDILFATNISRN